MGEVVDMIGRISVMMFGWCGCCVFGMGHFGVYCLLILGYLCPPVGGVVVRARGMLALLV